MILQSEHDYKTAPPAPAIRFEGARFQAYTRNFGNGLAQHWREMAADQIRTIARLRNQRLVFWASYPGRRTPGVVVDSLAPLVRPGGPLSREARPVLFAVSQTSQMPLGYYRVPLSGLQLAATQA
jgi:hypothetical protein